MSPLGWIRLATWSLILVVGLAAGWVIWSAPERGGKAISSGKALIGGPFQLVDMNGQPVTEAIFKDRAHAIFFGFTHCPDVCPTTLGELAVALDGLGPDAVNIDVYFVTVDPARDTPALLKSYVTAFSSRFVGLTGSEAEIAAVTSAYRVVRAKVATTGDDYVMDHSASVLLFDAGGNFSGTLSPSDKPEDRIAKLKRLASG
jgi:protein SCO1